MTAATARAVWPAAVTGAAAVTFWVVALATGPWWGWLLPVVAAAVAAAWGWLGGLVADQRAEMRQLRCPPQECRCLRHTAIPTRTREVA
ncbi:hypothetical protein [Pseudonocardia asaccharolytica]|uniref:Uncharacterized protein n=1 Tax=Pseudonocardia asaccharolytica DSM 44247 = NBRC 16224 TaxID=1123024 RepID=A0A511D6V0_9PSEU|nr:hypothetical protein [Pseudonocardia asaccharolytica]GEL19334.1 hypothetical protein PA7_31710 [Pseudonocardia asaccharolytica DSM 44247 = NBRC 16224]